MNMNFIDLFAGCGGLSLGLMSSGMTGLFAIEKTESAFETLISNLNGDFFKYKYNWPRWLPKRAMTTEELLTQYNYSLDRLYGKVDLIAGGPPCQGFSLAGLRNPKDSRNRLTDEYIKIVEKVNPRFVLLENVKGFQIAFKDDGPVDKRPYSEYVIEKLSGLDPGYLVFSQVLLASNFFVPQRRPRFIMIGIRKDVAASLNISENEDVFSAISNEAIEFKKENNLNEITTVKDAIEDLKVRGKKVIGCEDSKGFRQIKYIEPEYLNPYLKMIRKGVSFDYSPNSLRLANHRAETIKKFQYLLDNTHKGHAITEEIRAKINSKKQCFTVLSPNKLSTTITTLPDDCMHYDEPRILSVRECARIQSFPDWFSFKGKYTTGGKRRKRECPRYTQVGNAVPPIMAEIIGRYLVKLNKKYERHENG